MLVMDTARWVWSSANVYVYSDDMITLNKPDFDILNIYIHFGKIWNLKWITRFNFQFKFH